jgi:anti-sigma regulatory factor (Ser/Thr protein kinase)/anti-anti-sigma regulatory factor
MKNKEIDLKVPASLNYSSFIRILSAELAEWAWFTSKDKNMLKLIVDEIFMNAVKYWSNSTSFIYIKWYIKGGADIHFSIEDEWKWEKKATKEDLLKIIKAEKRNDDLEKFHWRWLAQIASVLTNTFEIEDSEKWWIKVLFSKQRSSEKENEAYLEEQEKNNTEEEKIKIIESKTFYLIWEIDLLNLEEKTSEIDKYIKEVNYPASITLDCIELSFFNSTCIWKIAYWYWIIHKFKWKLNILNVSAQIFEILDLVWIREIIKVKLK